MGAVQNLRWWQWVLISLLLGTPLALLHLNPDPTGGTTDSDAQMVFERALLAEPVTDGSVAYPNLKDLIVYPPVPDQKGNLCQYVTFRQFVPVQQKGADPSKPQPRQFAYEPRWFVASVPYSPLPTRTFSDKPPTWMTSQQALPKESFDDFVKRAYKRVTPAGTFAVISANPRSSLRFPGRPLEAGRYYNVPWNPDAGHTVVDYLSAAAKDASWVKFRYAWWAEPKAVWAVWLGGSFAVIGVLTPLVIRFMVGAGLGRAVSEDEAYLARFGNGEAEAAPAAAAVDPDADLKVKQLEEALEASLRDSDLFAPKGDVQGETKPAEEPVKVLHSVPAEPVSVPAAPSAAPEEFDYGAGQFYPVAHSHGKKHE